MIGRIFQCIDVCDEHDVVEIGLDILEKLLHEIDVVIVEDIEALIDNAEGRFVQCTGDRCL